MKKLVTVYGSLLKGLGNWHWHLNNPNSMLLGEHTINGGFVMVSLGGFPGLIPDEKSDSKIFVETYEVTEDVYKSIERLEGYPHFYDKRKVQTPFGESEVYVLGDNYYREHALVPETDGIVNWRKYKGSYGTF